jgi:hypothetical protein
MVPRSDSPSRRAGLRGVKQGLVAAEAENLLLWPGGLVLDRIHPDRREGRRPKLATSGRVVAYELATHAVFGAVLGGRVRR